MINMNSSYTIIRNTGLLIVIFLLHGLAVAQHADVADSAYYDFWVGDWHQVVDGEVANEPRFKVKKGLYGGHLEEEWQMEGYKAKAWRGWDSTADRWVFTWVSELGHYQVWNEKKVGDHWYMFKTFTIDGEEVLSRQAFIPQSDGTVIRTSEHSRDGGDSWRLRFREVYIKKESHDSDE